MSKNDIFEISISEVEKDLRKVPQHVIVKLLAWVEDVATRGIREVRKTPSYHDEPLKGKRLGQRSIRLSKAYRAIYVIDDTKKITFIKVIEVNKHDY